MQTCIDTCTSSCMLGARQTYPTTCMVMGHVYNRTCIYEVMYIFVHVCMETHIATYMYNRGMYDRGGFVSGMLALDSLKKMWTAVKSGIHNKLLNISYKLPAAPVFEPRRLTIHGIIFFSNSLFIRLDFFQHYWLFS